MCIDQAHASFATVSSLSISDMQAELVGDATDSSGAQCTLRSLILKILRTPESELQQQIDAASTASPAAGQQPALVQPSTLILPSDPKGLFRLIVAKATLNACAPNLSATHYNFTGRVFSGLQSVGL
jgi:hypothetical protein